MKTTAGLEWWMAETDGGHKLDKRNSQEAEKAE